MQGHFAFLFLFADFLFKKNFLDKKKTLSEMLIEYQLGWVQ